MDDITLLSKGYNERVNSSPNEMGDVSLFKKEETDDSKSYGKLIILKCSDEDIKVEEWVAMQIDAIKYLIEDLGLSTTIPETPTDTIIPVPNVPSKIMGMLVRIVKNKWNLEGKSLIKNEGLDTFFDLVMAADFLNMKEVVDGCCEIVAEYLLACKSEAEMKAFLNISGDFCLEEMEQLEELLSNM